MRIILLLTAMLLSSLSYSQVYTQGGASQLYWKWRPDIADSCYEFTFVNYKSTIFSYVTTNYGPRINLFYWNDCDYGKNSMVIDSSGYAIVPPLHDTLFRVTSPYGILDTVCGFNVPYNVGSGMAGGFETNSPNRRELIYSGLIYLPEKCRNWHFAIGHFIGWCPVDCHSIRTCHNGAVPGFNVTNTKSNIDSFSYDTYFDSIRIGTSNGIRGIYGCSMNNLDFPNNNSVRFTSPIMYYFPTNKEVEYNPGPYDPDYDSLVISIPDTIKSDDWLFTTTSVGYAPRFFNLKDFNGNPSDDVFTINSHFAPLPGQTGPNPIRFNAQNNPFDTDSTFHLVDSTGKTTFTAKSDMQPLLYYSAKKYRNNKFVNETYTINQFTLIDDTRPVSFMKVDTANVQGAVFNSDGTFMGCADYPVTFDAYVKIPFAPTANLIVKSTADTTLPGNGTCIMTNLNTDSVHLKFNWTPPLNAKGLYNVFISAKDSNCQIPYYHYTQVYTWSFYIDSCLAPMGVPATQEKEYVFLYPNPASDKVTIRSGENISSVKIYTLLSELVAEIKSRPVKQVEINTSNLSPGIYLVNIDGKYVRKLVIER